MIPADTEDHRAQAPGICGATRTTGGTEWVCVKQAHHALPGQHYMVNRWPWRTQPTVPTTRTGTTWYFKFGLG